MVQGRRREEKATYEHYKVTLDRSWLPLSENLDHLLKMEPCSQDMRLNVPLSSQGLKLSNSKPRCSLGSSLICEIDTTNGFLPSSSFRWGPCSASYCQINSCFIAGKQIVVYVTLLLDTRKRPSSYLYSMVSTGGHGLLTPWSSWESTGRLGGLYHWEDGRFWTLRSAHRQNTAPDADWPTDLRAGSRWQLFFQKCEMMSLSLDELSSVF